MTINYPNSYPTDKDCEWYIAAPKGKRLILHFTNFATEPCCDYLNIFEGNSLYYEDNIRDNIKGNVKPDDVLSTGNELTIDFTSDSSTVAGGFEIIYDIVDEG